MARQRDQYEVIARAIRYIRAHAREQPSLSEIATHLELSESYLQRTFSEWTGISPKRFLQYLTKEHARQALRLSKDVLSTSIESGLSSPGRLHDLMISCEAMTPGEVGQHGQGVAVRYGYADTPFGKALFAWTPRGICFLEFCSGDCKEQYERLSEEWSAAELKLDDKEAGHLSSRIFSTEPRPHKLHLLLRGTNFQIKVWEALLKVDSSELVSYGQLAQLAGSPQAQRAVGSALAQNRIAYLIPCHRVIREGGELGQYRWGSDRKLAMQAWEAGRFDKQE